MKARVDVRGVSLPIVTMPHLWALTALVAVFVTSGLTGIWLGDFWWHLKVGEIIATSRQIPTTDSFSFIASGMPYVYQQWLGELYLYLLFRIGGIELAVLANTLVLTATAALVLFAAWERSHNLRIAAGCTVTGMFIGLPNRDVRPQMLGFLFFAVYYLLLLRYRRGAGAPLWLLPLVAAIWANVHGSVVLGLGLCLLVFATEVLKARVWPGSALPGRKLVGLGVAIAASVPAMLLNPWGPRLFEHWLAIERNPVIQNSSMEWFAPTFRNPENVPFFLALLACAALFALSPRPLDLTDTIVFVVLTALALQAVRNSVWFGIVAAPLAAGQVAAICERWRALRRTRLEFTAESAESAETKNRGEGCRSLVEDSTAVPAEMKNRGEGAHGSNAGVESAEGRDGLKNARGGLPPRATAGRSEALANYLFGALLLGLACLTLPWVKPGLAFPAQWRGLIDSKTPVAAVKLIGERFPAERFFHPDIYGSYMIWVSAARPAVFVDGRIELYPVEVWQDYIEISMAQGWEKRLAKYGIRHIVLARDIQKGGLQQPLLAGLQHSPGWERVYEDEQAIVYVKGN